MPLIVKDIIAEILPVYENNPVSNIELIGYLGVGEYINIGSIIGFLQNNSKTSSIEILNKPVEFGLKNIKNMVELQISY